jgi:ADP-ribose pyrophosphatase
MTSVGETSTSHGKAGAPWRRLNSVVVHRNRWFEVRQDSVVQPDGSWGTYSHVVTAGSVTVLAINEQDRLAVTRQWIYTHVGTQWRLPGGGIERTDADPLAAARRELAEETGLHAETWDELGRVNGADSFTNHVDNVFLATDLTMRERCPEPTEADLVVCWLPFAEALHLVTSGELTHASSAYAVLSMAVRRATGCLFPAGSGR